MARYINVDDVALKGIAVFDENLDMLIPLSEVRKALQMTPTANVAPKSEVEKLEQDVTRLEQEIKALVAFKDYFSDLYGQGLDVANWHKNGALEPFDNFYESAEDEYEAELKKKYTEVKDG